MRQLYIFTGVREHGTGALLLAKENCRKCGGVGQVGKNIKTGIYLACGCVVRTMFPIRWFIREH